MKKKTCCLMIQGTTSDAGKTALVTGLCRLFSRRGMKVSPFKPQNMALNSAVTIDGGEIGRAQALQAQACGIKPHTDMNPVLLKPNSDTGAQVIIHGKVKDNMNAISYHQYKKTAMKAVLASYYRLAEQYEFIIVEGAGSPAEINLREHDIANMGFAEAIDCAVVIVADIEKGGVFAHLYGTLALLSESEQQRVKGFIINKFRGDVKLLTPGNQWLEKQTNKSVLGILPYLHNLHLDAEDAINIKNNSQPDSIDKLNVVVPVLSRLANHTDFDALQRHPQVNFQFVAMEQIKQNAHHQADLIILPGSKSVRADLQLLMQNSWLAYIQKHLRYGGKLLGICGGYQMLGLLIDDPLGVEGKPGSSKGFALLNCKTTLLANKTLKQVQGYFINHQQMSHKIAVQGYEIHAGITIQVAKDNIQQGNYCSEYPLINLQENRIDGLISNDNQVMGTYLHGIFDTAAACQYLLKWAGLSQAKANDYKEYREDAINLMADTLENNLDINHIIKLAI